MKSKSFGSEDIVAATRKRWPYSMAVLCLIAGLGVAGCQRPSDQTIKAGADRDIVEGKLPPIAGSEIWIRETPSAIYDEYVLSEKFLDEDTRPWREEMFKRFGPLVKDCKTRREAIMLIAKNAEKLCGVKYSTERRAANQCAAESLESGKATCTGLSILLAAAYRSVGIPSRIAGVGEWGDRAGNHTWVEVWDGDWHVVEYYPDEKGLDRGWIYEPIMNLDPANPRSRVMAVGTGGTLTFFLPWDEENKSISAIDRTEAYQRRAAELGVYKKKARAGAVIATVVAQDSAGKRVAKNFRILDGAKEIFTAKTPGPLADLNDTPRVELSLDHDYVASYTDASGAPRTKAVRFKAGELAAIVLPAE